MWVNESIQWNWKRTRCGYGVLLVRYESIQWNWKLESTRKPSSSQPYKNPFNGIESKLKLDLIDISLSSLRIHSMELKVVYLGLWLHQAPSTPNPFNGIESIWVCWVPHPVYFNKNPFNGIERYTSPFGVLTSNLTSNPFNGIERGNIGTLSNNFITSGIHSMELKDRAGFIRIPGGQIRHSESIQWNWK